MNADQDLLKTSMLQLLEESKVLTLATVNEQHLPEASLTPFIYAQGKIWIFVSQLSAHTQNMLRQPAVSLLIMVNQADASNMFNIERLTIECQAIEQTENRNKILDLMVEKLGKTVTLLRQLPDFQLFALNPGCGSFIQGFGKAYDVNFTDLTLTHINPSKH